MTVGILGTGAYLPEEVVTNDDIEASTDYAAAGKAIGLDEWARRNHGGVTRRRAATDQATSDLATMAAVNALADAGMDVSEVDLLVLATVTSDHRLPQSAAVVQANLGMAGKFLQLDSACTGFMDGLQVANALTSSGHARNALVVAADVTDFCLERNDWLGRSVFGDGAAAVVLGDVGDGYGFLSFVGQSEGELGHLVAVPVGGSRTPVAVDDDDRTPYLEIDWKAIGRWGVDRMSTAVRLSLDAADLTLDDVQLVVPHQASARMIEMAGRAMGLSGEKLIVTYPEYGNTVGSSLPIALDHAARGGRLSDGDIVVMCAVGAGMAWSASVYRWGGR